MRAGVEAATGDPIVFLDADLTIPVEIIDLFLQTTPGTLAGYRLSDRLLESGHDVRILDSLDAASERMVQQALEGTGPEPAESRSDALPATEAATLLGQTADALAEAQAKDRGHEVVTTKFNFQVLAKANIVGEGGIVKLVADKGGGPVLGVHLVGPHVTDLIAEVCAALEGL